MLRKKAPLRHGSFDRWASRSRRTTYAPLRAFLALVSVAFMWILVQRSVLTLPLAYMVQRIRGTHWRGNSLTYAFDLSFLYTSLRPKGKVPRQTNVTPSSETKTLLRTQVVLAPCT